MFLNGLVEKLLQYDLLPLLFPCDIRWTLGRNDYIRKILTMIYGAGRPPLFDNAQWTVAFPCPMQKEHDRPFFFRTVIFWQVKKVRNRPCSHFQFLFDLFAWRRILSPSLEGGQSSN